MSNSTTHDRLLVCFRAVFPGLSDTDLVAASPDNLSAWDSVAQVTLISVIEEELTTTLPLEQYGGLTSFAALLAELEKQRT
jgi:acyl carrier protein